MSFISVVSGVSLVGTDRDLHIVSYDDETTDEPTVTTFDLANREAKNFLGVEDMRTLITSLSARGRLCLTADAYAFLHFEMQKRVWPGDPPVVTDDQVDLVFPAQGHLQIDRAPTNCPQTDMLSRWAAAYYYQLANAQVRRWDGQISSFEHRAANTKTFRCYARYHNIKRTDRQKMGPVDPRGAVLQFDWSAAEWNLILQTCGYQTPEGDAYQMLAPSGVSHEQAKNIVLPYIYGEGHGRLVQEHGQHNISAVVGQIERLYPQVLAWREHMLNNRLIDFHGFIINLGSTQYKRPNRFAQTALQLCKWDLMSRIAQRGGHALASGDLHDQLMFHANPGQDDLAHAVVEEVRKPLFGAVAIPAKMEASRHWM